ncbi:asparaginase [Eubacterium pyruvativorans]|uniref:asparaginase n=1 Tax=Eubacterium pyruvativorans TaxID=155865 RepID=UPI003F8CB9B7
MKKRILLIGTGGTIACKTTEKGLTPAITSGELISFVPDTKEFCDVDTIQVCNIDSTDITPREWALVSRAIEDHYDQYDGFVICHGTDTLAYTAAALSYMIQNSRKPVVITGAQKPIDVPDTDARVNLHDSLLYASDPESQNVSIVFGGSVIAGTRAKKERAKSYNAFSSINYPKLADIRGNRIIRYIPPLHFNGGVQFCHDMNGSVCVFKLIPGISSDILSGLFSQFDCIILESFGVGGIPAYLMEEFTAQMQEHPEKLAIIATQVVHEGSDMNIYKVGRQVKKDYDLLETYDMTIEAAVTKAKWILAKDRGRTHSTIKRDFYSCINHDVLI